ncbi:MAG TPA: DUF4835 family protein [Phaeodactylibacter sp.]|nr:DUF4835 family protein [Phaeodactylibacter sp.]
MKKILLLILTLSLVQFAKAQELLFDVKVNTPKIQDVDPKVFSNMETAIQEFLNNKKWTEDVYEPEEKIKCKIQLTIEEELSQTSFRASLAIQSTRPIFGSSEETPLLNHVDKDVIIDYEPFQPIVFSKNSFQDNLSSLLGFYVNIILGMDYDSFSPMGGEKYFQIAQEILTSIPQSATSKYLGWRQLDGNRNRYWIIENLTSPRIRDYRMAMYKYHREGLDKMHLDPTASRATIMEAIMTIKSVNRNYPSSMILQMFANSKRKELIEIMKKGDKTQKDNFFKAMVRIDASNASDYGRIGK